MPRLVIRIKRYLSNRIVLFYNLLYNRKQIVSFWQFHCLDTDDCAPMPCRNGGSCTEQVNGYACNCVDGYEGTNCETGNNATPFQICYTYQNIYRYLDVKVIENKAYIHPLLF